MKALRYILYSLIILGAGALLAYQALVDKNVERTDYIKCGLIIAAAVLGMVRKPKNRIIHKKTVYQKAYAQHIQGAFEDDSRLEKLFYNAIHDYNNNKLSSAITKLEKLRKECQRSADLRSVTVFLGLCCDDAGLIDQAIGHYESANAMRPNSSICSNLGLCYQRSGNSEAAEKCYLQAISLDPKNAIAFHNLSTMYFRQANYQSALEYAQKAIQLDANMPQALSCAAMCCALLDDKEGYESYYRRAVASGYDGRRITATVQRLQRDMAEIK